MTLVNFSIKLLPLSPYSMCNFRFLWGARWLGTLYSVVGRTLLNRFWHDCPLFGAVISKKKIFFIYAHILMGFFSSEVKFNFKTLLFMSKFWFFFWYIKSYSYFFDFLKIFIFLLVLHFSMNFSQILYKYNLERN